MLELKNKAFILLPTNILKFIFLWYIFPPSLKYKDRIKTFTLRITPELFDEYLRDFRSIRYRNTFSVLGRMKVNFFRLSFFSDLLKLFFRLN